MSATMYALILIGKNIQLETTKHNEYKIDAKTPYKAKNRGFFTFLSNVLVNNGISKYPINIGNKINKVKEPFNKLSNKT